MVQSETALHVSVRFTFPVGVSTQISGLPLVSFAQDTQNEAAWSSVQEVSYKLYFYTLRVP